MPDHAACLSCTEPVEGDALDWSLEHHRRNPGHVITTQTITEEDQS